MCTRSRSRGGARRRWCRTSISASGTTTTAPATCRRTSSTTSAPPSRVCAGAVPAFCPVALLRQRSLSRVGRTASLTGPPIKAGESNYTEMGAEMGILGSTLWTAWVAALFVALVQRALRTNWWAAVAVASAFGAALVLAVQTDVIGDPWMGYVLWSLAGLVLATEVVRDLRVGTPTDAGRRSDPASGRKKKARSAPGLPAGS